MNRRRGEASDASVIVNSIQQRHPNTPCSIISRHVDQCHATWLREVAWAGFKRCPSEDVRHMVVALLACFGDDTAATIEAETLA